MFFVSSCFCFFQFLVYPPVVKVTSPALGNQTNRTTVQSRESSLPADQSHSLLDTDSVDISGGGIITQLEHSPESDDQSDDSDVEDGIPTGQEEPVVLLGVKRLVSQSTATDFSDSEYDDNMDTTTPGSKYKIEDDSGVIVTEWTDDVDGASPHTGKPIQVSLEQVKVADGYEEKRNPVLLATTGSDEAMVEGSNPYSGNSYLQGIYT